MSVAAALPSCGENLKGLTDLAMYPSTSAGESGARLPVDF